jgi:hypothetical protein
MAAPYQHQQQPNLDFYSPQWPLDTKQNVAVENEMSLLDEKCLDSTNPANASVDGDFDRGSQKQPLNHPNGTFPSRFGIWQGSSQPAGFSHSRPLIQATMPMIDTMRAHYMAPGISQDEYGHEASWSGSAMSGTSTPTPNFDQSTQEFHQLPYQPSSQLNFSQQMAYATDSFPNTAMSPQSSQGGWMSATSSDGTESRSRPLESPGYRATSPSNCLRRDGIRKKNARFPIPEGRNLATIDRLILDCQDEHEKKDLKQQKRLLRNRQAA